MTDICFSVKGERIVGMMAAPLVRDHLLATDIVLDIPITLETDYELTKPEIDQIRAYVDGKKIVNGALVDQVAQDPIDWANEWAENCTALEVSAKIREIAVDKFDLGYAAITNPDNYNDTQQRTWPKQEKVAMDWSDNWNDGTPTYPVTDARYKVLVNMVAGELKIDKTLVTDAQVNAKALSVIGASDFISPYIASVLRALNGVIDEIEVIEADLKVLTINEEQAKTALLAVDTDFISAVAAAELVELGLL
jgi:predicted regulator of Ras-like GTPase activity (Roadblock/LC7/MglB family)